MNIEYKIGKLKIAGPMGLSIEIEDLEVEVMHVNPQEIAEAVVTVVQGISGAITDAILTIEEVSSGYDYDDQDEVDEAFEPYHMCDDGCGSCASQSCNGHLPAGHCACGDGHFEAPIGVVGGPGAEDAFGKVMDMIKQGKIESGIVGVGSAREAKAILDAVIGSGLLHQVKVSPPGMGMSAPLSRPLTPMDFLKSCQGCGSC